MVILDVVPVTFLSQYSVGQQHCQECVLPSSCNKTHGQFNPKLHWSKQTCMSVLHPAHVWGCCCTTTGQGETFLLTSNNRQHPQWVYLILHHLWMCPGRTQNCQVASPSISPGMPFPINIPSCLFPTFLQPLRPIHWSSSMLPQRLNTVSMYWCTSVHQCGSQRRKRKRRRHKSPG